VETIEYGDFAKVDLRAGTVIAAEPLEGARKPAYRLSIDFGELGVRQSSAQITRVYQPEELLGRQVVAVVNLPPKRIAGFVSECLVCGFDRAPEEVVLIGPSERVPNGSRLY
jgi:tRNA-binding protein